MPVIGYDEAQEKDARHRHVRLSRETAISSPAEQCRIEDGADRSCPVDADGEPSASADGGNGLGLDPSFELGSRSSSRFTRPLSCGSAAVSV